MSEVPLQFVFLPCFTFIASSLRRRSTAAAHPRSDSRSHWILLLYNLQECFRWVQLPSIFYGRAQLSRFKIHGELQQGFFSKPAVERGERMAWAYHQATHETMPLIDLRQVVSAVCVYLWIFELLLLILLYTTYTSNQTWLAGNP